MEKRENFLYIEKFKVIREALRETYHTIYVNNKNQMVENFFKDPLLKMLFTYYI